MSALSKAVRRAVIERDQGRCVLTGAFVVDPDTLVPCAQYSIHHRRPRGMGGSSDPATSDPANLLLLSGTGTTGAHGWIEAHRAEALRDGFLVSKWATPAVIPVRHWLHGLAFVTADGWVPVPPGPEGVLAVAERSAQLRADTPGHVSHAGVEVAAGWVAA